MLLSLAATTVSNEASRNCALSMNRRLCKEKEMYFSMLFGILEIFPSVVFIACMIRWHYITLKVVKYHRNGCLLSRQSQLEIACIV